MNIVKLTLNKRTIRQKLNKNIVKFSYNIRFIYFVIYNDYT